MLFEGVDYEGSDNNKDSDNNSGGLHWNLPQDPREELTQQSGKSRY